MKEAYYFSHDSNSRNDGKILKLRIKHGMRGYGIFWAIIEMLRDEGDYKMRLEYDRIAFELHEDSEIISSVINDFGLFIIQDGFFWSESLLRRMMLREEKSQKARESALSRWNKQKDTNALRTDSDSNAIKGKEIEIKQKEIKEEEKDFSDLNDGKKLNYDPEPDSEQVQKATKSLADFFSISQINHPAHYMKIGNFCRYMEYSGNFEYFRKQATAYMKLKSDKQFIHGWKKYIGTAQESYQDGSWNEKDWELECKKTSKKTSDNVGYSVSKKLKSDRDKIEKENIEFQKIKNEKQ